MNVPVRLGAVSYLNARPLVYGLERQSGRISLRFDVPSECARLLERGEIDLGMIPSIAYPDGVAERIVPGVCIGSVGPVASVALFTRVPAPHIRRLAVDTSSRTSVALTRILMRRWFQIDPVFSPRPPDLATMLADADAALLIGDKALFVDHRAHGAEKIDLGEAWTAMSGLPFVWAFWAGRAAAVDAQVVELLSTAAEAGMARTGEIAAAYCADEPSRAALAERYLREYLAYHLDDRALAGLRTYYREAAELGIISRAVEPKFY